MIELRIDPSQIPQAIPTEIRVILTNTYEGRCTQLMLDLDFPISLLLIKGLRHIECDRLEPGETLATTLVVKAKEAEHWMIPVHGFSYRGPDGVIRKIKDYTLELDVVPSDRQPVRGTSLQVGLSKTELVYLEWGRVEGFVRNVGEWATGSLSLLLEGPVECNACQIPALATGASVPFSISVKPQQAGENVPVRVSIASPTGAILYQGIAYLKVIKPLSDQPGGVIVHGGQVDITYGNRTQLDINGGAVIQRSHIGGSSMHTGPPKCPNCGNEVSPQAKFCDSCGTELSGTR